MVINKCRQHPVRSLVARLLVGIGGRRFAQHGFEFMAVHGAKEVAHMDEV